MYLLVNDNLQYIQDPDEATLGDQETARSFRSEDNARLYAQDAASKIGEAIAVIDAADDDFVVYVAEPEDPSLKQRKRFALIGARIARKSAVAYSEANLGDDKAYEDASEWRRVCEYLEGDAPELAGEVIAQMETGCRDFLSIAPLGGPREALAQFAGLELLD